MYFNYRDKNRLFCIKLEFAILQGDHDTDPVGNGKIPKCLHTHIEVANGKLDEPFSENEIKQIKQSITAFLYDMTRDEGRLGRQCCMDLVEFMDYIPEPEILVDYITQH